MESEENRYERKIQLKTRRAYRSYVREKARAAGKPAVKGLTDIQISQAVFEELYLKGRFSRRNMQEMRSLADKLNERNAGMAAKGNGCDMMSP